ncbi:MAG: spermidine/putrescine ABC transporter substrate-binding protein [Clostridia bacterium]|nr:spermidine/putrescine ABC transporter substrate-binding protein [Clostridia bacterium]
MKKLTIFIILVVCLSAFLMTSCKKEDGIKDTVTLNVYNWGEYISDGFEGMPDTNAMFEEYFNTNLAAKYGFKIKVNYTTYATNEDMYSKLSSGAGDGVYDVIFPSDYMLQRMADEGMLHSFNVAEEIPNYKYIIDDFKGLYYDTEEQYSIPYTYGMVGIIYNPTLMDPEDLDENGEIKDKSWSLLWNKKYSGKILQFNNPRDAFGTAMYYHNIDVNTADRSKWVEALGYLREQKEILQGYVNDEIFNKMTTASAAIAPYFVGDYVTMAYDNEDLKFYYPKEGTNVFVDAMCIPESSSNKAVAKEYINFMLSEEAAVANAIYVGYASPNSLVIDSEEYLDEMGEEAYDLLYGSSYEELNANYDYDPYYHGFSNADIYGDDMQQYVNGLWEQLKTETDVEVWVHVSSITIVVALLAVCSYSIYIKKKRSKFYRQRDKDAKKA